MALKCRCGGYLSERHSRLWCENCQQYVVNNGGTYIPEDEYKRLQEQGAAAGAAIGLLLLIGIPILFKLLVWLSKILWKLLKLVGKLFGWILSMLALPVTIIAKKPKIVLPIYTGIAICILLAVLWYNTPEQKFKRAQEAFKSSDNQIQYEGLTLLKAASKKNYVPAMVMYADVLLNGKFGEKANPTGAFVLLEKAADLGDGKAWYLKGKCLEDGLGTIRNLTDANACYQKAVAAGYSEAKQAVEKTAEIAKYWTPAYKGNAEAQYKLGLCYADGNGIAADDTIARQWFTKSANANYAPAQVKLCIWMVAGKGGPQDAILGLSYCEKAAKQNYPEAYTKLGEYYYEGKVVARNYTKAIKYLAYASKKGSASAAFKLGFCLKNGYGITQNRKKAFAYFQLAAKRNYAPGKYALGECYEKGIGIPIDYTKALSAYTASAKSKWTNADIKKSQQDAAAGQKRLAEIGKWWSLANEKNDAQAQCNVGTCYFTGNGVKKDFNQALAWFQKSAAQDNLEGIVRVADCQFHGYGIKQDAKAAVETYLKAAEKGQPYAMFRLGQCYEAGTGIKQNLTSAYNWYLKAASAKYAQAEKEAKRIKEPGTVWDRAIKENNPEAQHRLACCYYFGDSGLPKNLKKAYEWFKKSSDQGFVKATHNLGFCYLNGYGTEKNLELMKKCFFEAAKKDFVPSICTVGEMYQKGIGVEQNLTTAYQYYAKAAASQDKKAIAQMKVIKEIAKYWAPAYKGNAKAQYMLGFCYYRGNGIERDNAKAEEWFLKSANQDYAPAQYNLAIFYSLQPNSKDNKKLIAGWMIKAASNGHVKAMVKLGEFYYTGEGVKEDYDKSVELWEKAAKSNNADAMFLLGKHRFNGRGIFNSGKDVDKAIELWTEAEKRGHIEAAYSLAEYYYKGTGLMNSGKDRSKAYPLYRKAADGGHVEAMYRLGHDLYEGDDIKRDKTEGIKWLKKAAAKGHKKAKSFLKDEKIE